MGLLSSIFGSKPKPKALANTQSAAASTATATDAAVKPVVQVSASPALASPQVPMSAPTPKPESPAGPAESKPGEASRPAGPAKVQPKLGFFGGLKQKIKGEVDEYVSEKAEEAREMAEEFRAETLAQVKTHAFELLDITEQRIDKKLAEIEKMLDDRLQQELRMRLRAMIWTLAFVLLMAIVSIIYVWAKQQAGLDKGEAAPSSQH